MDRSHNQGKRSSVLGIGRYVVPLPACVTLAVLCFFSLTSCMAQNREGSPYPFSWSGATTYSLNFSSSDGIGSHSASATDIQDLESTIKKVNEGYFSALGVEALVIRLEMEESESGSIYSSTDPVPESVPTCALSGKRIGDEASEGKTLADLVDAAHAKEIRVALAVDATDWCGAPDTDMLSEWYRERKVDGVRFDDLNAMSRKDVTDLETALVGIQQQNKAARSVDSAVTPDVDFWVAGAFDDITTASDMASSGLLDAVSITSWEVGNADADSSLSSQFGRSVTFSVEHPLTSIYTRIAPRDLNTSAQVQRYDEATRLLLQPGAVDIVSGREGMESEILSHWQRIGTFRDAHPAIGIGAHEDLSSDPYMFYRGVRLGYDVDEVVVVLGVSGPVRLNVSKIYKDDTILRDAYTGAVALVSFGQVSLNAHENGVILLEEIR